MLFCFVICCWKQCDYRLETVRLQCYSALWFVAQNSAITDSKQYDYSVILHCDLWLKTVRLQTQNSTITVWFWIVICGSKQCDYRRKTVRLQCDSALWFVAQNSAITDAKQYDYSVILHCDLWLKAVRLQTQNSTITDSKVRLMLKSLFLGTNQIARITGLWFQNWHNQILYNVMPYHT